MKKIALMMLFAVAAIVACEKTPDIVPEVTVTTTELSVPVEGSDAFVVEFNANVDWTAKVKEAIDWCTISPASGKAGDSKITAVIDPSQLNEERTATIVVTAGNKVFEIVLTQNALPYFTIENALTIPVGGGSVDFAVATNVDFDVTVEDNDWLAVAKGEGMVTFTATENTSNDPRSVVATFTTDVAELGGTLTITQDGLCKTLWAVDMTAVMNRPAQAPMFSTDEKSTAVSIALYDGNVVVCAGDGSEPVVLDKATGEKKGTIATGAFKPYSVRQDDAGNLVMANRLWNRWIVYGNWFHVAYLTPGSSELKDLAKDVDEEYLGVSLNVRGDVTKDALVAMPHQNGDYAHNVMTLFSVADGVAIQNNLTLTSLRGAWGGAAWGTWPHNTPGIGLFGPAASDGGVICCYESNIPQYVDFVSGVCTDLATTPIPNAEYAGNFAPTSIDIRTVNGKPYVAIAMTSFWGGSVCVMIFDGTTQELLYTWEDAQIFDAKVADQTNYDYMSCSVTLEAAEGGMVVYVADKTTATIAAKFFKL